MRIWFYIISVTTFLRVIFNIWRKKMLELWSSFFWKDFVFKSWLHYYTSTWYPHSSFFEIQRKNESFLGSFNSHEERVIMVFAPHLLNIWSWKKIFVYSSSFFTLIWAYTFIEWPLNIRYSLFFMRSWDHFKDKILIKVIKSSSAYVLTLSILQVEF